MSFRCRCLHLLAVSVGALSMAPAARGEARVQQPAPVTPVVSAKDPAAAERLASARLARNVTASEIRDAIRRSGLEHAEVRARLSGAGYDPSLADPFFPAAGATSPSSASGFAEGVTLAEISGNPVSPVAQAFQAIGLMAMDEGPADAPERPARPVVPIRPAVPIDPSRAVFGKDVFNAAASAFAPVSTGPVDASYRLGPGDQVQLVLFGDTEKAYQITVRPDGSVLLPELGQIHVGGLTLDAARAVLRERASSAYSGIKSGTTRLDLTVSRVRSNALFVIGEVERPGAVQVNALSTIFHAVAKAGGPSERGSFRLIELRRSGKVVRRFDLYQYLVDGDASSDLRTDHGDVIFVPLAERRIRLTGAVRRTGTFELLENERFSDLLRFAGGFQPSASLERIQIDRVLPAEQRSPGVERALVDVHFRGVLDSLALVRLMDGDVVTVFSVGEVRRNMISIRGEVLQPGTYELEPGLELATLVDRAQGILPWGLIDRVKVTRMLPESGGRMEMSVDLGTEEGRSFRLQEFDEVVVLDGRQPVDSISVAGAVRRPVLREFAEGLTLRDVLDASGLKPEAAAVTVSRRRIGRSYSDTTSEVLRVELDPRREWQGRAAAFAMAPDDRVFVLSSPGVRRQRFVTVSGLFAFPGRYAINEGVDRVSEVVRRAGMPLQNAFHGNFQLIRNGLPLSMDLSRALRGDANHDVVLLDSDSLFIGPFPSTVMVTGEVGRTVLLLHRPGRSMHDYIAMAGGPTAKGDLKRATVEDLAGTVRTSRRVLFVRTSPPVTPGSKIVVPAKLDDGVSVRDVVNGTLQYASMLASLALAFVALR